MMSVSTKMTALSGQDGHTNQLGVLLDRYDELTKKIAQYSSADQKKAQESAGYLKAEQKQ